MHKLARPLLLVVTFLLVWLTVARVKVSWHNDAYLDHVSGEWVALAADLKDGIFYRPLFSDVGYGGTRYFPLPFVLHAGFLKLGGDVRVTGYALAASGLAMLLVGVYVLLRGLGVDRILAGCSALLVLASNSTQLALLSIRGDVLPAALNVWGVALCTGPSLGRRRLYAAALLFALAFSAKATTVFGLAAVFISFLFSGRFRLGWKLLALTATGYGLVLGVVQLASGGRWWTIIRACASGGATLLDLQQAPLQLLQRASLHDSGILAFVVLAAAAFLAWPDKAEIPPLFFLFTALATTAIFGSPGANINHLLDLQVASVILFAAWTARQEQRDFGLAALAIAALVALWPLWSYLHNEDQFARREQKQAALRLIGNTQQPILSENPLLPVLTGQRPYLLDAFMLRLLRRRDPSFADPLWRDLRQQRFAALVLREDPETVTGRWWYITMHFGDGFAQEVKANYERVIQMGDQYIYKPRRR